MLPIFKKRWKISRLEKIEEAVRNFSLTEKVIFFFFVGILIITSLSLLWRINNHFLVEIPDKGGSLKEGIIGSPRFINPLLADSNADKDLTSLVYSGLLKATPDGEVVEDLAESYYISDEGLSYTFFLKDNIYFHDGNPVTVDDIEFTIKKAQDPTLRSPKRASWENVEVEILGEKEIRFTLGQPYAPFIHNFTLGIIPKHIWEKLETDQFSSSLFNVEPVGSGPYKVKKVKRSRSSGGLPVYYHLTSWRMHSLGEPYIEDIIMRFYPNEEELLKALEDGVIESAYGLSPQKAGEIENKGNRVEYAPMSRIFGVFFNQTKAPLFINKEVREALNLGLDKERIVREVLGNYGIVADGPVPPVQITSKNLNEKNDAEISSNKKEEALEILEDAGWEINKETGIMEKETGGEVITLSFSISTSNTPELYQTAIILKEEWAKIGAEVELIIFESRDELTQNAIRPREYDALLFGTVIRRGVDFYPFWHSSQRNDPGLNIALYTNISVDNTLEETRTEIYSIAQSEAFKELEEEITSDMPAVFIYSPYFIYTTSEKIKNIKLGQIDSMEERFLNIHEWYINTNKVWKIFSN